MERDKPMERDKLMERDKPMERDKRWRGTSDGIAWNGG